MQTTRIVPGLLIACALLGCSGGDEAGTAADPSAEPSAAAAGLAGDAAAARSPGASGGAPDLQPNLTTWSAYSGGAHASQFSAVNGINKENVATLRVAWTFPSGDANLVFNPIVVDDVMYVLRARGQARDLVALNAATGEELWSNEVEGGVAARGIHYWQSANGNDRRLVFHGGGFIKQIDAETGATITSFGDNGRVADKKFKTPLVTAAMRGMGLMSATEIVGVG